MWHSTRDCMVHYSSDKGGVVSGEGTQTQVILVWNPQHCDSVSLISSVLLIMQENHV